MSKKQNQISLRINLIWIKLKIKKKALSFYKTAINLKNCCVNRINLSFLPFQNSKMEERAK